MDTVFYLFGNMVYVYIMYMFTNIFFDKEKTNRVLEFFLYVGYYIIHIAVFMRVKSTPLNAVASVLPFIGITFIYRSSILKKILVASVFHFIALLLETFVFILFDLLKIDSFYSQDLIYFSLLLAIVNLLSRFFSVKRKNVSVFEAKLPVIYYITLFFVPCASIIIGLFARIDLLSLVTAIVLLFINVDIYYLYNRMVSFFAKKHENEMYKSQTQAYINELRNMKQSQMQIKQLKHDMNNHILKMQYLLKKHEYKKLEEYLSETQSFNEAGKKIIDCGNDSIGVMLNYKLSNLKETNVEADFNIAVPSEIKISDFDLNVVLGNLLDNSLEAMERLSENERKRLSIDISCKQGVFKMIIGNTFDGSTFTKGKTNKNDSANHGIGLISVERTIKKYDGFMKTEISDDWFEVCLMMYESEVLVNA